jgi:soluble lytic murein transglycosylase
MRPRRFGTILLVGLLVGAVLPSAAQQPEVRSLFREPAPEVERVTRETVAPLFGSDPPARVAGWLAAGQAAACRDQISAWLREHPRHPHAAEAGFLVGYCAQQAGDHALAFERLSEAATGVPLLGPLAAYQAAVSAFELERYDATVTLTLAVPDDSTYAPRARYLRARALRRAGRPLEAVGVLRDFVERYPRAWYIAQAELELGRALADLGELETAAEWYHRVSVRYPGSNEETQARRALEALLPRLAAGMRGRFSEMTDEDLLVRAQVLFDRHRSREVIDLLTPVLERLGTTADLGCQAWYLVGKSYTKLREHGSAAPFYDAVAGGACGEDLTVWSLYNAGRALWNVDRDAEAAERFRALYTAHSSHSYADDAMLYEARIARGAGRHQEFVRLLEAQIARFPEGEMVGDANWLLFQHELNAGNEEQAIAFADAVAARTGETDLYSRGRLAYFRGRALERLGRAAEAAEGYAQLARDVPLSYYALLALNRLRVLDGPRATTLVAELHADGGGGMGGVPIDPPAVAEDPNFERGLLLLRLGLLDLAQQQFDTLKSHYPNQDGLLWLMTFLFDAAGAYHISHDIPRRQIASFLSAYPTPETIEHWQLAFPTPFLTQVVEAAESRGLDRYLVYAIMREESGFNPRAESWANARGLMQLMEGTAESMAARVGLRRFRRDQAFDPDIAIRLGSEYLSVLANRYGRHPVLTIAGYNGGEGNVDRWVNQNGHLPIDMFVEEIPFKQTRDYTKRVLMTYWIYTWLYGDQPLLEVPFQVPSPS